MVLLRVTAGCAWETAPRAFHRKNDASRRKASFPAEKPRMNADLIFSRNIGQGGDSDDSKSSVHLTNTKIFQRKT
jgi:hypothetical protein